MVFVESVTSQLGHLALVPLAVRHEAGLCAAAQDGKLRRTSAPEPHEPYIHAAIAMKTLNGVAFSVTDANTQRALDMTKFHNMKLKPKRVGIGYTPGMPHAASVPMSIPPPSC